MEHQRRVASIRQVVECVVTAAVVFRDNIGANSVCEAHDSGPWFRLHGAVKCMEFALEIEYVLQLHQYLTLFSFQF